MGRKDLGPGEFGGEQNPEKRLWSQGELNTTKVFVDRAEPEMISSQSADWKNNCLNCRHIQRMGPSQPEGQLLLNEPS